MALATCIASLFLVALEGLGLECHHCCWEKLGLGGLLLLLSLAEAGLGVIRQSWGRDKNIKNRNKKSVPTSAGALASIRVSWSLGKAGGGGVGVGTVIIINTRVLGWGWPSVSLSDTELGGHCRCWGGGLQMVIVSGKSTLTGW